METATKNLENDHVHILQLIDIMEQATEYAEPDYRNIEIMIELIKSYADGIHHTKEENLLFPLLIKRGFSKEQGPIAVMLHEHDLGRTFVKGMVENLEQFKKGRKTSISLIYKNMKAYIELLRGHISKENNVLFKMADKALTEQDQLILLEQYKQIEKSDMKGSSLQYFINQINALAEIYHL